MSCVSLASTENAVQARFKGHAQVFGRRPNDTPAALGGLELADLEAEAVLPSTFACVR